ncbi:MAG TPA: RNA polymerase sigma factor [Methylomusa anaerophila]|uniref:ECF RNA polymerase sigma factor SigW n=1 Tax=Methylomusa anaerophila TaxID=1930071 RepID=A0A348AG60_9FIRM|nr:RNA polymerase sigma factor [Methylomusa anaerophila]BBB90058.1 ECF RNA polymerase sigma factor SigW [Methylomusa anaerophila]HML88215.1 RNA polymerase sigma factor [Methylomusa anaerophila]
MIRSELNFEQVYAIFQPRIYRYLERLIGINEVEDVTQEVFIKVGKALDKFGNKSQLSTWIYQIATNTAIDRMRSRSYKQDAITKYYPTDGELNEKNMCFANKPLSIEEQVIRKEMNECIQGYVAVLPENYRIVFVLSEMERFKVSEIAALLGLSVNTVKMRLHRAKKRLKELLLANCNFYRTECNELACEPKGPAARKIKPFSATRH